MVVEPGPGTLGELDRNGAEGRVRTAAAAAPRSTRCSQAPTVPACALLFRRATA
ncbi:MAG: hypothetical protein R2695_07810 [Acidimicrobiales bacterium]